MQSTTQAITTLHTAPHPTVELQLESAISNFLVHMGRKAGQDVESILKAMYDAYDLMSDFGIPDAILGWKIFSACK